MSDNFTIRRSTSHVRTTSLPSLSSHALDSNTDCIDLLRKLNTSEIDHATFVSSISNRLCDIRYLYNTVDMSIQCPLNQQVLSSKQHRDVIENVLEGSLGLLDACASAKDVLTSMKESIFEIQSCLRRKNGGNHDKDINAYITSRKNTCKMANKGLKNLLKIDSKKESGNVNNIPILGILREAERISFSTLKSILTFSSKSKSNNNVKGWCLVGKLMHSIFDEVVIREDNEIERIDKAIFELDIEAKKSSRLNVKMGKEVLKELERLESFIEEIELCLESISRCLLKIRVSLLNIVSSL